MLPLGRTEVPLLAEAALQLIGLRLAEEDAAFALLGHRTAIATVSAAVLVALLSIVVLIIVLHHLIVGALGDGELLGVGVRRVAVGAAVTTSHSARSGREEVSGAVLPATAHFAAAVLAQAC